MNGKGGFFTQKGKDNREQLGILKRNFKKNNKICKKKVGVNMTDYLSMSFYNHIGWLKQKIITTSVTQSKNIKNWGRQRAWNRGKVYILHSKWQNVETNRLW